MNMRAMEDQIYVCRMGYGFCLRRLVLTFWVRILCLCFEDLSFHYEINQNEVIHVFGFHYFTIQMVPCGVQCHSPQIWQKTK
jgi:hypothetical protein